MKNAETIKIFDTTLYASEQSPGAIVTLARKIQLAQQLARLRVDTLEIGAPAASGRDMLAIKEIARRVRGVAISAQARTTVSEIDLAWEALREAATPVLHIQQATSDTTLGEQRVGREEVLQRIWMAIRYARKLGANVEFSALDAVRSDETYLCSVVSTAIAAGAQTVTLADTAGHSMPNEYEALFRMLQEKVVATENITLGAHCHDDLGLATANTLAAIRGGARQVRATINGIGERAGDTSLEEVVTALRTRSELFGRVKTRVCAEELQPTSQMVSCFTGIQVQPYKAVVGMYAWTAEAEHLFPLHARLGRHDFAAYLWRLGYQLSAEHFQMAYERFIPMLSEKQTLSDTDLIYIVESTTETPAAV